jgi:anaerobic ribonucleoside-triphosphate reductase activating protein
MTLRVNYILPKSSANGPGIRFTIWVQGCSIHCDGCINKDTWDPAAGKDMPIDEILAQIEATAGLNGVTITGGEPLDQFGSVFELCKRISKKNLTIFLTTGYTGDQLIAMGYDDILSYLDIICLGPFEKDKVCRGEWKGSSNQHVVFLTDIGKQQGQMPKILKEIFIAPNGSSLQTGFTV